MKYFMKSVFVLLFITITLTISGCSAPKPTKISFSRNMKPINFNDNITDNNIVIKSSEIRTKTRTQNIWNKQFVYEFDDNNKNQKLPPEFFYAIAHADKIIAHIKPPFVDYVFSKVQSSLRGYGVMTKLELFIEEESDQNSQVILKCIKFEHKRNSFFNF